MSMLVEWVVQSI